MSFDAPSSTPNLLISVNPLVINAANELSPKPNCAAIPAQNAIIFFNAPPNSTPFTSLEVYNLIIGLLKASITFSLTTSSFEAITQAVGISKETSSA